MTLVAKEPQSSEHWYTREGTPRYTITAKNGKERPTTLRDARVENLVPSVTTVLNVAAKPALIQWMQKQVLMAALTLPRQPDEPEAEWIDRIMQDSREEGRAAANMGTDIHAAIESFFSGQQVDKHADHVRGCVAKLQEHFGHQAWIVERSFAHEIGFGGKIDLHCPGIVADVKSKDFTDPTKVKAYDEHMMQLSAYRVGIGMPDARCANVFVSRTVPGLTVIHEWSPEDLQRGWQMFHALLTFWQHKNNHR